jgi:hypothetical protein
MHLDYHCHRHPHHPHHHHHHYWGSVCHPLCFIPTTLHPHHRHIVGTPSKPSPHLPRKSTCNPLAQPSLCPLLPSVPPRRHLRAIIWPCHPRMHFSPPRRVAAPACHRHPHPHIVGPIRSRCTATQWCKCATNGSLLLPLFSFFFSRLLIRMTCDVDGRLQSQKMKNLELVRPPPPLPPPLILLSLPFLHL